MLAGACAEEGAGGIFCDDDIECIGMVLLSSSCAEARCIGGSCGVGWLSDGAACAPEDPCLVDGACENRACVGGRARCDDGVDCTVDRCDVEAGRCHVTLDETRCDDGDPCTLDRCDPEGCEHELRVGAACDDGAICTEDDRCGAEGCAGTPVVCEGEGACVFASCSEQEGGCLVVDRHAGFPCEHRCYESAECDGEGHCVGREPRIDCGPAPACRAYVCNADEGCQLVTLQDEAPCLDPRPCFAWGACVGGACAGALPVDCDDGNACTSDRCDEERGCENVPLPSGAACEDGDRCTWADRCYAGVCVPGDPAVCSPGDACVHPVCDPLTGACGEILAPEESPCDDGDPCTGPDRCRADGGCTGPPVMEPLPCDDGDPCTIEDACADGGCAGQPDPCDDGNACTDDACPAATGACVHPPVPDGRPCGSPDPCSPAHGSCAAGLCEPLGEEGVPPEGSPCDDGLACTTDDICRSRVCTGLPDDCDDRRPCTVDACVEPEGCVYEPATGTPCDDGEACTIGDACLGGVCEPGTPAFDCCHADADCEDDQWLSLEYCDPEAEPPICDRRAHSCFIQGLSCSMVVPNLGAGEGCLSTWLWSEVLAWEATFETEGLGGMRAVPAGGWQRAHDPERAYDGEWALVPSPDAPLPADGDPLALYFPPLWMPAGAASVSFRYWLDDAGGDGCESGVLRVVADGAELRRLCRGTNGGYEEVLVPIYRGMETDKTLLLT